VGDLSRLRRKPLRPRERDHQLNTFPPQGCPALRLRLRSKITEAVACCSRVAFWWKSDSRAGGSTQKPVTKGQIKLDLSSCWGTDSRDGRWGELVNRPSVPVVPMWRADAALLPLRLLLARRARARRC
jgi:hypothetical protein